MPTLIVPTLIVAALIVAALIVAALIVAALIVAVLIISGPKKSALAYGLRAHPAVADEPVLVSHGRIEGIQ